MPLVISKCAKLLLLPSDTSLFLQPLHGSVFKQFKTFYNNAVSRFLDLKGLRKAALPTRDDIPKFRLRKPSSQLQLTVFLNLPVECEYHAGDYDWFTLVAPQTGTASPCSFRNICSWTTTHQPTEKQLERKGLDVDAVNVVTFHAKILMILKVKSGTRGSFLTARMTKGVLLTDPETDEAFCIHSELKAMQAADQEYRSIPTSWISKRWREGPQDESWWNAVLCAWRVLQLTAFRRTAQRTNTATPKARKKAETQQVNEAQWTNRKRYPVKCRAKAVEPQRKRGPHPRPNPSTKIKSVGLTPSKRHNTFYKLDFIQPNQVAFCPRCANYCVMHSTRWAVCAS